MTLEPSVCTERGFPAPFLCSLDGYARRVRDAIPGLPDRDVQDRDVQDSDVLPCCLPRLTAPLHPATTMPLPALSDEEGPRLADDLPAVVDAHVHVFPPRLFAAVWRWFDQYGWPVRYRLHADEVVRFQLARGVRHLVLLHYAHKPGIARDMNAFVADVMARFPGRVTGLATVAPGEERQEEILEEAFGRGLRGVKLHCHVQAMAADDVRLFSVYDLCAARGLPVVIHAGREPWSPHLPRDPHELCDVSRVLRVLQEFPRLKLCVPHLGADEFAAYADLARRFDRLWLDTTMMTSGFFDIGPWKQWVLSRPERVLYGSDFPNLPYAWDREVRALAHHLPDATLQRVLARSAQELFGIADGDIDKKGTANSTITKSGPKPTETT